MSYQSAAPATITWIVNGQDLGVGGSTFSDLCWPGYRVQAVVGNPYGSTPSSIWAACNPGPWL